MLVKSIIAHPIHGFHQRPKCQEPVIIHVVLPVAYNCFRIYPHACCESGSYPIFFFLASHHHCDGIGPRSNLSSTSDCQNCLKTYFLVNWALSLSSAFGHTHPVSSANKILFFFPFRRTHRRKSARLSSDCQPGEQVPKHLPIFDPTRAAETCATEGQPTDVDQGTDAPSNGRGTHYPSPYRKRMHNKSRFFVVDQSPYW